MYFPAVHISTIYQGLPKETTHGSDYVAELVNSELERMWKEAVMDWLDALFWYLSGWAEGMPIKMAGPQALMGSRSRDATHLIVTCGIYECLRVRHTYFEVPG